ncbi:N-6 DNA methylase [Flavobacterium rhizosphaerae]|uniref:N-6 DNA methylase n=1 Tax=Flavobacterium rhizosphaerae TaxID=3163298 RepID=A0ABW8Z094_9FLAO
MIKTQEAPKGLREFNKIFNSLTYRHEVVTVFDDLLTIIICCLGRGTNEPLYFDTIKRYNPDELQQFAQLFAELCIYYEKEINASGWADPLGTYYELLAGKYKKSRLGQYFTPAAVCTLMAELTVGQEWGQTMNEPCCGSGRIVLAANHKTKGNYYVCEDLDPICCKMTAINLCMHEIRGEVHCHNALTRKDWRFSYAINYEYWKHKTKTVFMYKPS